MTKQGASQINLFPTEHSINVSSNFTRDDQFFNSENEHRASHWTFVVATAMMQYALPVIIFVGFVGNTASFLVFLGRDLRKLSSSVYVIAVLTSDTGMLISLLFVWLEVFGIRLNHEEGVCQFLVFLTYACSFLSVWYTVCITVENYIAICHPTRVRTLCTRRRAIVVVSVLAVASLPLYILSAVATEVRVEPFSGRPHCTRKQDEYVSAMQMLTIVDSVITLLLPLVCVTAMLVAISLSIIHTYRWRRSSPGSQKRRAEFLRIPQVRVAKMLFALSLSFVVMNSPSHVYRLYSMMAAIGGGLVAGGGEVATSGEEGFQETMSGVRNDNPPVNSEEVLISKEESLVQLILLFGSYCYYAVKFMLFLIFSQNFRRSIRESCTDSSAGFCLKRSVPPAEV